MKQKLSMKTNQNLSIKERFDGFIRKCKVKKLSDKTIETYHKHFRIFEKFLVTNELVNIAEITLNEIEEYVFYLKENSNCKDITINT